MTEREWVWLQSVCSMSLNAKARLLEGPVPQIKEEELKKVDIIYSSCDELGIRIITFGSPDYPEGLKNIYAPPYALYVRGKISEAPAFAVIGTRNASPYGMKMAGLIASELAEGGAAVISLLTGGIDRTATEAALDCGGKVIAVAASSPEMADEELAARILASGGAVISEHCPGVNPNRAYFRSRNRIASGISRGVVVVEAPMKSGTRLFVEEALEQGRDVFAVPGNADSENSSGIIRLIREGAVPVCSGRDVLEETGIVINEKPTINKKIIDKRQERNYIDLTVLPENELMVLEALQSGIETADEITESTGLGSADVLSALTMLQIQGIVKKHAGGFRCEGN